MQERPSEIELNKLLPLLSVIAQQIASNKVTDHDFLISLLSNSDNSSHAWALEELQKWSDILRKVSLKPGQEESIIGELQDLGVPEAPAVLAVNAVINPPSIKSSEEYKVRIADIYTAPASEAYHKWLPDHAWHYDLDWNTLPPWIKRSTDLVQKLSHGQDVLSRFLRYTLDDKGLKRKLHDHVPIFMPLKPREKYNDWLPDHEWHNDLDEEHLPEWIIYDARRLNDLISGRDVFGKYVRYKYSDNRLWRKLHDSVYVQLNIKPPMERYHTWLPDHNWHSDLDWQHLPLWIKSNPQVIDLLRRGKHVAGKFVIYKYENNRLVRRLKDGMHIRGR